MNWQKSAGEPASTEPPNSASRTLIFGSASAALISPFSFSTISTGVPLGTPKPVQEARLVAGDIIAYGRKVRQCRERAEGGHCQPSQLASPNCARWTWADLSNIACTRPPSRSVNAGPTPRYGTWTMSNSSHCFEKLSGKMLRSPVSRRSKIDLARIGFGKGNQLRDRRCRH